MREIEERTDEEMESRGLRTQAQIMLDPLRRGGGGAGGSRERSAWIMLACYADGYATVEMACEGALAKGAIADDLAQAAIAADAPLALRWCVEQGGLTPLSLLPYYGVTMELGELAITSEAGKCVGMLESRVGPISVPGRDGGREDGLLRAARGLKLSALRATLAARAPDPKNIQKAMDLLSGRVGSHWSSGESNPADLARALMEAGGKLGGPALEGEEPVGHAMRIAQERFVGRASGASRGSGGGYAEQSSLIATWRLIAAVPGWTGWAGARGAPPLGEFCLALPGLDLDALASIFKDGPGLLADPSSARALAEGAARRAASGVGDCCALFVAALAMGASPPRAPELAAILAQAMPGSARAVMPMRAKEWVEFYATMETMCADPALASCAKAAGDLYAQVAKEGAPRTDELWARWESAALGFASIGDQAPAERAKLRL